MDGFVPLQRPLRRFEDNTVHSTGEIRNARRLRIRLVIHLMLLLTAFASALPHVIFSSSLPRALTTDTFWLTLQATFG